MKVLFIAYGYLPYTFSENLCNAKLVYALQKSGWEVDVISKTYEGPAYCKEWQEPWLILKEHTYEASYKVGNLFSRSFDLLYSTIKMGGYPIDGIRWARRAYEMAVEFLSNNHYDAIITRSPTDISHIVGYKLKKKFGIKWIANWNDPATTIWPEPYTHHFPLWKHIMLKNYSITCLRFADINTFPSQTLLDHFEYNFPFLSSKKNLVIPHIGLWPTLIQTYHKQKGTTFTMCHSGNMSKERNPELLFKAMRYLIDGGKTNLRLDIMGQTNDFVQILVQKYELKHYVHFLGGFPYMEAVKKLQEYDALILLEANLNKGIFFASKFTDYAQVNRPILALSPVKGFAKDIITKYGGGLVVNNMDFEDIKDGLLNFYHLWEKDLLHEKFNTERLFAQFSPNNVVKIYNSMI